MEKLVIEILFGIVIGSLVVFFACGAALAQGAGYDQFIGEVVHYDVRSLGVRQAGAVLKFEGLTHTDGREAYLINFKAVGASFLDEEKIYADKKDFFPLRIERDLNIFGSIEKIVEVYDQGQGAVTITKTTRARPQPEITVLKKTGKIDNIYCFIYRYRLQGDFKIGSSLRLNLPTKDVLVRVARAMALEAAGKKFSAIFLETVPSQYRLWFDVSKKRMPLRIDKPALVAGTSMIMTEYQQGLKRK